MKKLVLSAALAATLLPMCPVLADPPPWAPAHGRRDRHHDYYADDHFRDGRFYRDRRLTRSDLVYRGRDGRYYCRRSDGTTGLIIGGAIGALIGREIARGQSRTIGTIIGAGAGAVLGREIDRGKLRCD
jgi:Glycine zipper 2TM domain